MTAPEIAQKSPYKIELMPGQEYWRCACGRRNKQPLCNGSHKYRVQAGHLSKRI